MRKSPGRRLALTLAAALLCGLSLAGRAKGDVIGVMTQNLYVGADLGPPTAAVMTGDPAQIIPAVTQFWNQVQATNFPQRAQAIAGEVAQAQPLLIGLQEAALYRTGPVTGSPVPSAPTVAADYVTTLLGALAQRGLNYKVVAVTQNADVELPGVIGGSLKDLRLTDRDVILARADLPNSVFSLRNVQAGNFASYVSIPVGASGLAIPYLRGWASVDATLNGYDFRFISTHLENVPGYQEAQAAELLAGPANTSLPVILAGDFNSPADGSGPYGARVLLDGGFADAWSATHPGDPGFTWGQDADLLNPTSHVTQRIDYVLFRGGPAAGGASLVGADPSARTPSGLWPSDHAGLVVGLATPVPEPTSLSLVALGLGALGGRALRRR
ncbi:MAG TPA: endonuclease/exonuclease/phosphatase family protein, partial [Gemmataceae bacterium]|nr:endonuclease/exonuclease/phosphatase family protein [Gemmataceae bacterium]